MLSAVLIRTQSERNDFIEWMQQRGATVAEVLRSCGVKTRWLAMLQNMQRWQGLDVEDDSPLAQPRPTFGFDAVVAQRGMVRMLLPDVVDHTSVFCAAVATLLALDSEESFELLVAIEAAFTPTA